MLSLVACAAATGAEVVTKPITILGEFMYSKDDTLEGMGAFVTTATHLPKDVDIVVAGDYLRPNIMSRLASPQPQ